MVTVPARPAVLVLLSLVLAMNDCGWPLISVPSGFTFARSVLTLSAMLPAGAALDVNATIPVSPVRVMVSAVIVIAPGGKAAVPPSTAVVILTLLRATSLAASVASGPRPEMVRVPAGPPVLSVLEPGLLMNTLRAPSIGVPSGFTFTRSVLTLSAMLPAGAGPSEVPTNVAGALPGFTA